jgi:AcrR family transcriptional regulator
VVRTPPPERLVEVAEAATRVFGRVGYQRTHMADVAAEAGLSSGAVYTYVESKEALFHLVFARAFGQLAEGQPALPLATPPPSETLALIGRGLQHAAATPVLRAARKELDPVDVRAELTAIVVERYEMVERLWPILAVIERSAMDLPDLDELYFRRGRRGHHGQLARYLELRADQGYLRTTPDPTIAARLVTEAIAWFAWHRREDRDAAAYNDEQARKTVIQFVCDALTESRP